MHSVLLVLAILSLSAAGDKVSAAGGQEPPTQQIPFPPPTSSSDFNSTPTLQIFNSPPPPVLPSSITIINCCSSGSGNNGVTWLLGGVGITLTISVIVTLAVKFGLLSPKSNAEPGKENNQGTSTGNSNEDGVGGTSTGKPDTEIVVNRPNPTNGTDNNCNSDIGGFDCRCYTGGWGYCTCNTGGWGDNIIWKSSIIT